MQKNYRQLIIGIVGLVLVVLICRQLFVATPFQSSNISTTTPSTFPDKNATNKSLNKKEKNKDIPQKVYVVLQYIRANHHAMEGHVGGRVFTNREKIVPNADTHGAPIHYQEWDVNPKIQGQNRGSERILTGSDGRAWYTNDHYQTFTEIK